MMRVALKASRSNDLRYLLASEFHNRSLLVLKGFLASAGLFHRALRQFTQQIIGAQWAFGNQLPL